MRGEDGEEMTGGEGEESLRRAEDNWWTECGKMDGYMHEQELKDVWFRYATLGERIRRKNKGRGWQ